MCLAGHGLDACASPDPETVGVTARGKFGALLEIFLTRRAEARRQGMRVNYLHRESVRLNLSAHDPHSSPATQESPVSINAEMVALVDHAGHELWNTEKASPKTDADWANVEHHATQLAAAGTLVSVAGSGVHDREWVQSAGWKKWSRAMSDAGMAARKAAQDKNLNALVAANGQLVDACEGCHKEFKPDLPSEGITHVHAH